MHVPCESSQLPEAWATASNVRNNFINADVYRDLASEAFLKHLLEQFALGQSDCCNNNKPLGASLASNQPNSIKGDHGECREALCVYVRVAVFSWVWFNYTDLCVMLC